MLDTQQFTYTVDMFRDTLHLLVETLENPFVAPANIHTIEAFMNKVGYQCIVDKVSFLSSRRIWLNRGRLYSKKKEAIQYPCFIKLIVADLMKKFPDIPKMLEEDYHSIKDDVPLVSVYTTGNVSVQGMLILDAFLIANIRETNDFKEYETVFMKVDVLMNQPQPVVSTQGMHRITPSTHSSPIIFASPPETKKRKQIEGESSSPRKSLKITMKKKQLVEKDDDDSKDKIEPESHKDNPEVVDDDDNETEKKDDEMGSLEIRNKETQTTIPTPIRSPRKSLSLDKNIFQELTDTVSITRALHRMCRCQGYMIQDMERKCVTTTKFWETHNKIDDILHEVVP
ncbi:hypothetical protein Tco_0474183 [Tanacetum coccineum]